MTKEQLEDIKKIGMPSEELYQEVCDELLYYKQLEKQIGCPLDVFIKLQEHPYIYTNSGRVMLIKLVRYGLWWYAVYDNEYTDVKYPLSDYGKTFWLKEDRSE